MKKKNDFLDKREKGNLLIRRKKTVFLIAQIIFGAIIFLRLAQTEYRVIVNYKEIDRSLVSQIFYDIGNGWNEQDSVKRSIDVHKVKFIFRYKDYTCRNLRFDFTNSDEEIAIKNISMYKNGIKLFTLFPEDIINNLNFYNYGRAYVDNDTFVLIPNSRDPIAVGNEAFTNLLTASLSKNDNLHRIFYAILSYLLFNILLLLLIYIYEKKLYNKFILFIKERQNFISKMLYRYLLLIGIIVIGMILIMSSGSKFNAHPDEAVTKLAIDYYQNNWLPPDIRDESIRHTFSVYGSTRLREYNLYYFFAAKVSLLLSKLLTFIPPYRILNIILIAIMFALSIRYLKVNKKVSLMCALILTPQLWYIYSYATSDAFDYFFSFLCIYELIKEDSLLNKIINESLSKKNFWRIIVIGALFGLIFMAKPNYYVILLLSFVVLLFKLISIKKIDLFKKYLLILMFTVLTVGIRWGMDYYHYGFEKDKIVAEVREEKAHYEFKPSTEPVELYPGVRLYDRGVSLRELFDNYHFAQVSFKSLIGVYGYMQFYGSSFYYKSMLVLYFILCLYLLFHIIKSRDKEKIIQYILFNLIGVLSVCLSIYTSWFNDFQPQGRYVLTLFLILSYCISLKESIFENVKFKLLIFTISGLSVYSFIAYGITYLVEI